MKKIITLFMLLLIPLVADARQTREHKTVVLKTIEKEYEIEYKNGKKDDFIFVYQVLMFSHMFQDGHSARFPNPFDTRRCSYEVKTWVQRQAYYVTGGGTRVKEGKLEKGYDEKNSHANDKWTTHLGFNHHACNDDWDAFVDLKNTMKADSLKNFDSIIAKKINPGSLDDAKKAILGVSAIVIKK